MEKKKRSPVGTVFKIIGLLILAALIAAAVFVFSIFRNMNRQELELYNPAEPDFIPATSGAAEHLSFTDSSEMSIRFDNADMLYFFNNALGENRVQDIIGRLSALGLKLTGASVEIVPDGFLFNFEVYRNNVRIVANVHCNVVFSDGVLTLTPESVKFGGLVISADTLASYLKQSAGDWAWSFEPELVFISDIDSLEFEEGYICISGKMATDYLRTSTITDFKAKSMRFCQTSCCYAGAVIDAAIESEHRDCFSPIIGRLTETPELFTEFLSQLFTVINPGDLNLTENNYGLIYRWFPEVKSSYSKDITDGISSSDMHMRVLGSITSYTYKAYHSRKLRIVEGQFCYGKDPFDAESFYGDNYVMYRNVFSDIDNARLCLFMPRGGCGSNPPRLSDIADSVESISGSADMKARYAVAFLLRGDDGYGYVFAFTPDDCEIIPLEESVFLDLYNTSAVPVYIE